MIIFAILGIYLLIGWGWGTLVVYNNWVCGYESYTNFNFSCFLWPMDIARRIFWWILGWLDYYERRLREIRDDKEKKNL